jgi:predicted phosphatase
VLRSRRLTGGKPLPQNLLATFIETENIAYFKQLLKTEAHPDKRRILTQLLAEEEAKRAARIAAVSKT